MGYVGTSYGIVEGYWCVFVVFYFHDCMLYCDVFVWYDMRYGYENNKEGNPHVGIGCCIFCVISSIDRNPKNYIEGIKSSN